MMSKIRTVLIILIVLVASKGMAQTFGSAVEYMQYINESFAAVQKESWDYVRVASSGKNARKIERRRRDLIVELTNQSKSVKAMPGYNQDVQYRDQVVNYLNLTKIVIEEDFGKILDMEEIAEESYDAMEAYLLAKERASDKLNETGGILDDSQAAFAAKNNIRLIEGEKSKISKKLDQVGNVMEYYNTIYLVFFKVYKEEIYFLDATNQGNVGQMEQHRKSILQLVSEARAKLDTIPSYQRDGSIKTSCLKMLRFYEVEASEHFPKFTNFYLKKEEFETVDKAFQNMKKVQRTKTVIDNYNKAVNDYNASINNFNQSNELMNKTRSKNINDWNKSIKGFMDRNMP